MRTCPWAFSGAPPRGLKGSWKPCTWPSPQGARGNPRGALHRAVVAGHRGCPRCPPPLGRGACRPAGRRAGGRVSRRGAPKSQLTGGSDPGGHLGVLGGCGGCPPLFPGPVPFGQGRLGKTPTPWFPGGFFFGLVRWGKYPYPPPVNPSSQPLRPPNLLQCPPCGPFSPWSWAFWWAPS